MVIFLFIFHSQIQIYAGLAIFSLFIIYDTQVIVEKRRMGDDDFIWHSVDLFMDMVQIFRYLMIILANKVSEINNIQGSGSFISGNDAEFGKNENLKANL